MPNAHEERTREMRIANLEAHPPLNAQTVLSIRGGEWPVFDRIVSNSHPFTNFQPFRACESHLQNLWIHCRHFSHILISPVNSMFRV